ncbi:MAG: prepilin-type N-terminal cleavage/methylation domain-containing protein [Smithellaceae bacterium]
MRIRGNNGFSLIELLITIAIMGIVLAIAAPNFTRYRDNTNLREAARDISSDIQLCKQRALSENAEYSMTFNVGLNNYTIKREEVVTATKTVGAGNAVIKIVGDPTFADDKIIFQPRGTTNPGHLDLQHTTRLSKAQIITSIMGRVRVTYDFK